MTETVGSSEQHSSHASDDALINVLPHNDPSLYDDDGRLKRTGNAWTASAHIITALIGAGVMSLAWATAQLGWIAGPAIMILFSSVTYYTSTLLTECYRTGDPYTGTRNRTYMDAVRANLGGFRVKVCVALQCTNLFGVTIGYTIASSISMMAIERSNCYHSNGNESPCKVSSTPYMIAFGLVEIFFSQIPDLDRCSWLSVVAALMSFTFCSIVIGLLIARIVVNGNVMGSLIGKTMETDTEADKIWRSFQALGAIAFSYYYSLILIEIQDTIKSPPSVQKTIKRATFASVVVTTILYTLCGCLGYAALGDFSPGDLITDFVFYEPYWLLDIANAAIVIHLIGAYQVYSQPLFAFLEKNVAEWFPEAKLLKKEVGIPILGLKLSLFRLVWRTFFVIVTTISSMVMPFFLDLVGIVAAFGFWPLSVYFPVEMYIVNKRIKKWSTRWISLQILSVSCLIVIVAAAAGAFVGAVTGLKVYKPFSTSY